MPVPTLQVDDTSNSELRLDEPLVFLHDSCPQGHRSPSPRSRLCRRDSGRTLLDIVPEEKGSFMEDVACDTVSAEWMWDKILEHRGLYRGPYYRALALYALTPFTTLATFLVLAFLPSAYPLESDQWKEQHPPFLPFPLPELLVSIAFCSLSHLLRTPIFSLTSFLPSLSTFENAQYGTYATTLLTFLSCILYTVSALWLRVYSFAVLIPTTLSNSAVSTKNPVFQIVWWTALGWAAADATIVITQGYQAINLYKDVLVSIRKEPRSHDLDPRRDSDPSCPCERDEVKKGKQVALPCDRVALSRRERDSYGTSSYNDGDCQASSSTNVPTVGERRPLLRKRSDLSVISSSFASLSLHPSIAWDNPVEEGDIETEESELQFRVDRDIDHLLAFRKREELEELYGIPFIKIPVFVSCLHRVNALLQSLSFSLLLSAAYMHTSSTKSNLTAIRPQPVSFISDPRTPWPHYVRISITSVFLIHLFLTLLHTPVFLPKLGVHTVVYISSITALGTLFVGLAVWGGVS